MKQSSYCNLENDVDMRIENVEERMGRLWVAVVECN